MGNNFAAPSYNASGAVTRPSPFGTAGTIGRRTRDRVWQPALRMNLIVSIRAEDDYLRFDVQGQWHYNDALTLAYQVKAVAARERMRHILIDLREVTASPRVEGKFLVWDRLMRVLPDRFRIALLAAPDLVDLHTRQLDGVATVVLFSSERPAIHWLEGIDAAIKNPSALRVEGQVAGKET